LTSANNEILRTLFFKASTTEDGNDICAHWSAYKAKKRNMTKRMQHIAICKALDINFNGEDSGVASLTSFKGRTILSCEGYHGNSRAHEAASK
jgi:hypothetical protein